MTLRTKLAIAFLCLAFCVLNRPTASAQMPVEITTFNEVKYKIYPVRVPSGNRIYKHTDLSNMGEPSSYSNQPNFEEFLPYNPLPLDNGRYLAYHPKRHRKYYRGTRIPKYSHEDTTLVAVTFVIENERKNGEAVWYDVKGNVVQKGFYVNDVRQGEWKLYRKDYSATYTYKDGVLDGLLKRYLKGVLIAEIHYSNGVRLGESVYYTEKGVLETRKIYRENGLDETFEYDQTGFLYYHNFPEESDTSWVRYSIKTRKMISTQVMNQRDSSYRTTRWYNNGSLKEIEYGYTYERMKQNLARMDTMNTIYGMLHIYRNYFSFTGKYPIHQESYHANGKLELRYDFRETGFQTQIKEYNSDGILKYELKKMTYQPDPSTTWFEALYYRKEGRKERYATTPQKRKVYTDYNDYFIFSSYLDKKGRVHMDGKPYYFHHLYPDSIGLALMETNYHKKHQENTYNILHTIETVDEVIGKKGMTYVAVGGHLSDTIPNTFELTIKQRSKKGKFSMNHTIPLRMLDDVPFRSGGRDVHTQSLLTIPDTLEYRLEMMGVPFTGKMDVERSWRDKDWEFKVKKYKERYGWRKEKYLTLKVYNIRYYQESHWYADLVVKRGLVTSIEYFDLEDEVKYTSGLKQGEVIEADRHMSAYYINGQKNGLCEFNGRSAEYYYDTLHGTYIDYGYYTSDEHLKRQISTTLNYRMDTVNGWFLKYAKPQVYKERVYVEDGVPTGDYFYGNIACPVLTEAKLDHGFLHDTAKYYFSEGMLKVTCFYELQDSEYYAGRIAYELGFDYNPTSDQPDSVMIPRRVLTGPLYRVGMSEFNYLKYPMITFDANRTGNYVYYYKNGVMSQRGRVEDGFKVGTWDYWDLNGGIMKQIVYEDSMYINPVTDDTIYYTGKIKMWYPNGKPLLNGLVVSDFTQFKCDQELEVNFENIYYLELLDQDGSRMLENNNGQILEFHNNGELRVEGFVKDGKRDSLWKFYDPDGRLERMGTYQNGLEHGFWVEGDLEAIPHFYDRCVKGQVEPFSLPDAEDQGYILVPVKIREEV
ncbi:MAG: hypothetical protein KDC76_06495, partial [Bacteroidetes bacterium]|nr:hypothetical protein [Bacteroidota bacterium]